MSSRFNVLLALIMVFVHVTSSSTIEHSWNHMRRHGPNHHHHSHGMPVSGLGDQNASDASDVESDSSADQLEDYPTQACYVPPTSDVESTSTFDPPSPSVSAPGPLSPSIDAPTAAFSPPIAMQSSQSISTTFMTQTLATASLGSQTTDSTASITQAASSSGESTTASTQAGSSSGESTTTGTQAESNGTYWQPPAGTSWQIQLSGVVSNTSLPADVYDMDLFDNPVSTVEALHSLGKKVICYFSAGTYENWRPDASSFPQSDLGSPVDGWAGEWWLNVSSPSVRSIMAARIELAASNGCDGVDPDNVDGYDNPTGFSLTQADSVDYMEFLADEAHSRGMSIGLKNAGGIVDATLTIMEWQINESCVVYNECDLFVPFINAGKPVFHIEYPSDAPDISSTAQATSCGAPSGFSTLLKTLDLSAWVETC